MEAIGEDPCMTNHGECIVCETCTRICPIGAVRFSGGKKEKGKGTKEHRWLGKEHLLQAGEGFSKAGAK